MQESEAVVTVEVKVPPSSPIALTMGMSVLMSLFKASSIKVRIKPWTCDVMDSEVKFAAHVCMVCGHPTSVYSACPFEAQDPGRTLFDAVFASSLIVNAFGK